MQRAAGINRTARHGTRCWLSSSPPAKASKHRPSCHEDAQHPNAPLRQRRNPHDPNRGRRRRALDLEGADVRCRTARARKPHATLVGRQGGRVGTRIDGRTTGEKRVRERRTTVVGQPTEQRVLAENVGRIHGERHAGRVLDQTVARIGRA